MKYVSPVSQRGVALILVIWVIALMSILLGSFALIARTENLESRHLIDGVTARYAAEAGLERAIFGLREPNPQDRWIGDGRPYDFQFNDADVQISLYNESGKIDLNSADGRTLQNLFVSVGLPPDRAVAMSDAIQDWRDPDDIPRAQGAEAKEYQAAGLNYGPANGPFRTLSEVQQVLGMNYALFTRIEPAITIYSGSGRPNPAFAPFAALRTLPGMTDDLTRQIIAARQQILPGQAQAAGLTLPDGTPIVVSAGGNTYTVKSRATLPNGTSSVIDATIRLGGVAAAGKPYTVLRWRDEP